MRTPIHLHTLEHLEVKESSKRLNLFPGRAMSEAAFDKSQDYVADRIAPLLSGVWPGIQQGLEVDYLSVKDQQAQATPHSYTRGQLTQMAYASHGPAYPAEETMPGFNQLQGDYFRATGGTEHEPVEEPDKQEIEPLFRVKAGSAVTALGTVVKLFNPLEVKWSDLLGRSNLSNNKNLSGLYMLSLGREIIPVDYDEAPACRRHETDPMRDTRFETVGVLQLQPVENFLHDSADLIAKGRHKTINRFLSQLLTGPQRPKLPLEFATLGLLAIKQQKPIWFESLGCRFLSQPQGLPMALLAHTEQVFKEFIAANIRFKPVTALKRLVDESKKTFQALPAAGSLPRTLLSNVARIDAPLPQFAIDYPGLRVDMMPVPVTGVAGILRRELGRGVISFTPTSEERMRLLIAVPDGEYHPRLLDVPVSDKALSGQVYDYGMQAYDAWVDWREQLLKLYSKTYDASYDISAENKLTSDEMEELGLPDLTETKYSAPIAPRDPNLDMHAPILIPSEYDADYFFDGMIHKRGLTHKATTYKLLPPPYREGVPPSKEYDQWLADSKMELPEPQNTDNPGIIIKRAELEKDIDNRTKDLEQSHEFVEQINDLLLLQRQQLDSQSVSFATFAGGVAGDGSGLQLTRWLPFISFDASVAGSATVTSSETKNSDDGSITASAGDDGGNGSGTRDINNAVRYEFSGSTYYAEPNYKLNVPVASSPALPAVESTPSIESNTDNWMQGSLLSGVNYQSNDAYVQIAAQNTTASNYEMVSKLSQGVGKLAQISAISSPMTSGAFQTANLDFGVLKHISIIDKELINSHQAVSDLRSDMDELLIKINNFIADDLPQHIKDKASAVKLSLAGRSIDLPDLNQLNAEIDKIIPEEQQSKGNALRYDRLFKTNRSLVKEISDVDSIRNKLVKIQKVLQKYILKQKKELDDADSNIIAARKTLAQLDALRREAIEDYSAAQRLLIEHWQAVEAKFDHRNKVLNGMLGLYYVKVRETATTLTLPHIHSLSYAEVDDLVPGCRSDEQITLPDELDVFMDAVLDIPMIHWQPLSTLVHQLPGRQRLLDMLERRTTRIQSKQSQLSRSTNSRIHGFSNLRRQSLFVMHSFSERRYKSARSLKQLQLEAANVLSLEDLLNKSAGGRLRKPAQQLGNNLELACYCILEKLNELPPSIRLVWGQLAEDDQLPIDYPEKWPEIEKAEDAAFNSLRACLELVRWLNRQLSQHAEGDSRTALRNLVRACLMLAASDDPGDLLEGQLQVSPGILQLGSILRLSLNQEAVPGATLQLLDTNKRTIAKLRLDDQDNDGASATIINLFEETSEVNTQQFMVIGHKYKHV